MSIGIPVYNGERYLPDALDSVLAQTYSDFEVVISDNASTDQTPEICRIYQAKDERIRFSRNERNAGIVANFNMAYYLSRGPYFKWLAHDDLIAPSYLERCVRVLDEDQSAVVAAPRVALIGPDGAALRFDESLGGYVTLYGEVKRRPDELRDYAAERASKRFHDVVLYMRSSVLAAYVFGLGRSSALEAGPLHRGFVGTEKVLMAALALRGRLRDVPEELFFWRLHPDHVGRIGVTEATRRMDPTWSGRFTFMGLRQLVGYSSVVRASPLTPAEKARCFAAIVEKVVTASAARVQRMSPGEVRLR